MKILNFSDLITEISSDPSDDEYQAEAREPFNSVHSIIALSTTEDYGVVIHVGNKFEDTWMKLDDFILGVQLMSTRIEQRKRDFLS